MKLERPHAETEPGDKWQSRKVIAVYARVSTARQEEDNTIETQLTAVREFAAANGYLIVKEYIDDGWSGDLLARPQLDQLRQDAKKKLWVGVLAYDADRIARRYSYQELVMDELREGGIDVLFVTTPAPRNGEEKILHGVKGLFAEYERAKIIERFRLGKLRKVKEGHVLVSEAPYGYQYVPKSESGEGYFRRNETEAEVLVMIFHWVGDDGLTLRAVVKKLQDLGLPPRKSRRGVWSTSTLSHLLRNRTYIGEAHYGRSYAIVPEKPLRPERYRRIRKTSRRMRPPADWIKIPVPALLDSRLYERTQERLRINFATVERKKKNKYLLAGKIWCVCGSRRTGEGPQHGRYLYYRCSNKVNTFPHPRTCFEAGINARVADQLVWSQVKDLLESPSLLREQIRRWVADRRLKISESSVSTKSLADEIHKLKDKEERYNRAYGDGLFSVEKLREYISPIQEKITSLQRELADAKNTQYPTDARRDPTDREIAEFAQAAREVLSDLGYEGKRKMLECVVEKIVGTKCQLHVHGYLPIRDRDRIDQVWNNYTEREDHKYLNHDKTCSDDRHGLNTTRHLHIQSAAIPFKIQIPINSER